MADLTDTIEEAATQPESVSVDGCMVKRPSLRDLIEAAKHISGQAAVSGGRSGWCSLRPARVVPPDSVGPRNTEA